MAKLEHHGTVKHGIGMSMMRMLGFEPIPSDIDMRVFLTVFLFIRNILESMGKAISLFTSKNLNFAAQRYIFPGRKNTLSKRSKLFDIEISEQLVDGVFCRIYQSPKLMHNAEKPAIVYLHGGGLFLCHSAQFDKLLAYFAYELQGVVISIDYSLAPENPYPAALNDVITVMRHVFECPSNFAIDPRKVVILGDSGGGNLVAATCLKMRDLKLPYQPKLQILINPMLQGVSYSFPSYKHKFKVIVDTIGMASCYLYYKGQKPHCKDVRYMAHQMTKDEHLSPDGRRRVREMLSLLPTPYKRDLKYNIDATVDGSLMQSMEEFVFNPYVSPLFATDLTGLPDTYMFVAGYDNLRDEGLLYAERLDQAGVNVTLMFEPTAFHGGWALPTRNGNRYKKDTFDFIRAKLNIVRATGDS